MIPAEFTGDGQKYGLAKKSYDLEFKTEGTLIIVEVYDKDISHIATVVFPSLEEFFNSFRFTHSKKQPRAVRKMTDFDTTLYFTVGEVATKFGVTKKTINAWVKAGKLHYHHRIGGRGDRRFSREDVLALEQSMRDGWN